MRLKLDENLGTREAELLRAAGHEVSTVPEQNLCGATDRAPIAQCKAEARCLVTLDLDFGNPLLFTPSDYAGIAVLRLPPRPAPADLEQHLLTLIDGRKQGVIAGKLWVIQRGRIREHEEDS